MATNPMQRKARNSFLLGMLVMLLISAVIIAFLFIQLMNMKKAEEQTKNASKAVYVLTEDVKSGGEIILNKKIDSDSTDNLTISQATVIGTAAAADAINPSYISELKADSDGVTRVYAKVSMTAGTILTQEMIYTDETDKVQDNLRKEEYNMIILPTQLETGDFVDIRLMLPTGEDYIVISKKKVEVPMIGGAASEDTIWMKLTEDEILLMGNAIYDAFTLPGSKLYANLYTDPGIQKAATPTYPFNDRIGNLISGNPNILQEAKNALWIRYNAKDSNGNQTQDQQRHRVIDPAINEAGEQGASNQQTNMEESITNTKTERKEWLDSLSLPVTTVE